MQVSIDTAVQHCEVKFSGGRYVGGCVSSVMCFVFGSCGHQWRCEVLMVGCDGWTHLTWLGEHSQGGAGMEGLHIVFVCWQRYTFAIFSVHVGQCLCDVRGSCGPRGANKPTPSVTGDESRSYSTRTTILHPPHISCHLMPAVDPSISRNHAHPSLEGRGDEVVVCNVVLAPLEWWRKDICDSKTQSVQENV